MVWSTPLTAVANATLTAAQWNASVRDNLVETAPAKATAANQIFVATGANAIAARNPSVALVTTGIETTTSTTYAAITTPGPALTVTTGTKALVLITSICRPGTVGIAAHASYAVSGATTIAASDDVSIHFIASTADYSARMCSASMPTLTAGSNTFTMLYRAGSASTVGFGSRSLIVIPF